MTLAALGIAESMELLRLASSHEQSTLGLSETLRQKTEDYLIAQ
jgi:hypothetical protein